MCILILAGMINEGNQEVAAAAPEAAHEESRTSFGLFRRPEKFKIGEDFDLFARKINLYFEAVEVTDERKKRLAFLFNLNEDAFRLAEGLAFPEEGERRYEQWVDELRILFERNETLTEKRYNCHKRMQAVGETVDSFAIGLHEYGAKCGFQGNEYNNRMVDQFILGLADTLTQTRLLQEPPDTLDGALVLARKFEAARSTMQTLRQDSNMGRSMAGSVNAEKVCFNCNQSGYIAKYFRKVNLTTIVLWVMNEVPGKFVLTVSNQDIFLQFAHLSISTLVTIGLCREIQDRGIICYRCREKGHVSQYCEAVLQRGGNTPEIPSASDETANTGAKRKIRLSNVSPVDKKRTPVVEAKIDGQEVLCVVDTGASISLVSKEKWEFHYSTKKRTHSFSILKAFFFRPTLVRV